MIADIARDRRDRKIKTDLTRMIADQEPEEPLTAKDAKEHKGRSGDRT